MTPAAQTSEPQTEAGRELVEIAPQLWLQPSNRSMPMEPMQLEIRKAVLAIESEAQRLTVERLRQRFDFDPCHECDNAEAAYVALAREETGE